MLAAPRFAIQCNVFFTEYTVFTFSECTHVLHASKHHTLSCRPPSRSGVGKRAQNWSHKRKHGACWDIVWITFLVLLFFPSSTKETPVVDVEVHNLRGQRERVWSCWAPCKLNLRLRGIGPGVVSFFKVQSWRFTGCNWINLDSGNGIELQHVFFLRLLLQFNR